jgi:hypothetical protein
MGAGFGVPEGRIRTLLIHGPNVPSYMFDETGPYWYWHSIANSKPAGYQPTFTLAIPNRPALHVRFWSSTHRDQRFTAVSVFGGDVIAEYGLEARPCSRRTLWNSPTA